MTVSLNLANIANSISGISISGVTVKDKDEIAANWQSRPNVLYPNPNEPGWITDFSIQFDSILQGTYAPMTIAYTLNYRFLGTQIGDLSTFPKAYSDVVDKLILIINAIITTYAPYSGEVEMILGPVSLGAKEDPAGNIYHGADFALLIKEMQN